MTGSLLVGAYAAVVVAGDALPGLSGLAPKVLGALFVADTIRLRLRSDVSVSPPAAWLPWAGLSLLIGLSWWAGLYAVETAAGDAEQRVTTSDPMSEILYSPLGNAVVLLVLQFTAANVLFWAGVWVGLRVRRPASPGET